MAQFAAKGRLKSPFPAEGVSLGLGSKDPTQCKIGVGPRFSDGQSIPFPKPRLVFLYSALVSSPSSSSFSFLKRSTRFTEKASHCVGEDDVFDDYDGVEFGGDEFSCFRGLVLDISYRPVNVVCWRRAICLEFMEKADVLEYYDQTVNSPSGSFNIPAVLQVPHLLQVVKRRRIRTTLSRKNIFYRDNYMCHGPWWGMGLGKFGEQAYTLLQLVPNAIQERVIKLWKKPL